MDANLKTVFEKSWDSTCKILFGRELGPLSRYDDWLEGYLLPVARRKSHLSGKDVILAMDDYPANARFVSQEEVRKNSKYFLNINQIKDIDSIVGGIREQCEYSGNRVLGNSSNVSESDTVFGSHYVWNSTNVEECENIYSSFMMRKSCKHAFGTGWSGNGEFLLRVFGSFGAKRCFETQISGYSSDLYMCHNCDGCHDMLFSFGQRNASYLIGNLPLPKARYLGLKKKIVGEIADEIIKNKGFPPLYDLVPHTKPKHLPKLPLAHENRAENKSVIEKGFASTYEVILKRQPEHSLDDYAKWLLRHSISARDVKSPFGAQTCYPENFSFFSRMPPNRLVSDNELLALGKTVTAEESEIGSLRGLIKSLDRIGYFSTEIHSGENFNLMKSPIVYYATNIYGCYDVTYADNTGYCSFALNAKNTYGCRRALESQFSIKCYNSLHINRCFELDSCTKCADSYFCHNSEGLQDSMFCFNLKGARHFIGNNSLEKDKYAQVKASVLNQICDELDKNKSLELDIYNICSNK